MDPERWQQIERIYHAARELDGGERTTFLAKACGGDESLRKEVEFLLAQAERAGSFLESPAIEMAAGNMVNDAGPSRPTLELGTMVAHYRLTGKLGEGGMGEVYRARDTKLQRDVAIKILPQSMARDAQRMARFEREARTLASLNHPNIAAIYGLEESNGVRALVMELVEGETLAERINHPDASVGAGLVPAQGRPQGSPLPESLSIARQIAEALEYAHERGVIHRDLKPANVKITAEGAVKVLDFGLAKVVNPQDSSADPANSPTLSAMATQAGMILGTAAYMSPEQAKGQRVDRRCDIWAFGCVLFEMLAGQKPFEGETISDVLAAVIMKEPDWTALPETTPPSIQRLIRRCLQKDQRQRLQAIGDARIAIEETISGTETVAAFYDRRPSIQEESGAHRAPRLRAVPWALAALLAIVAALLAVGYVARAPKPQPGVRFTVPPPGTGTFANNGLSISPDGRALVFTAQTAPDKPRVLWLRRLDGVTAQPVPGTEGAYLPFWSPDGRYIGFFNFTRSKLETVAVSGGAPQTLCDEQGGSGGTWNRDGVILFSRQNSLYRVPATGGTPTLVTAADNASAFYHYPQFLPDGRHFLFLASAWGSNTVEVGTLDSKKTVSLFKASSNALYARSGYLLYVKGGDLLARGFNAKNLKFTGQAVPMVQNVHPNGYQWGPFSASQSGVLAYWAAAAGEQDEMAWFNRKGQRLGTVGPPGIYTNPALSPDGTRLAVSSISPGSETADIWIYNLKHGTGSRLTFTPALNDTPLWSNDGSRIYFSSNRDGKIGIYQKQADGLGKAQQVFRSSRLNAILNTLSPDDRYAIFHSPSSAGTEWALPLTGDRKPFLYIQGHFNAGGAQLSPNGRYIAYLSTETGGAQIYVQTFPQHLGKWQISTAGGRQPMWRSDGKELFYLDLNNELMSVDVTTSSGKFHAGTPKPLFDQALLGGNWRNDYAVSPDGKRFLMMVPVGAEAKTPPITVVVNWTALLKKQ